ncbi:MAG TPA: acyltransferase family protein [Nitrolancea sp.]|nr:acyltransferase family protein [Nitrolancea sp.]
MSRTPAGNVSPRPASSVFWDRYQNVSAASQGTGPQLPYLPGLDGLRALALIAVVLYHADLSWLRGGFLGVEVFFVLSGYLITSLLLAEWNQQGRIDLKVFWLRRARRLLPAVYILLLVTLGFAVLFLPREVADLRGNAAAAFTYVTNWYLVLADRSYFEMIGRPPALQHLWSLAIEEQFYLFWPLLFTVGMLRLRRRGMLIATLAGAVLSTLLVAILFQPNVDPSRVYYGTDTRAAELLAGAALAFIWEPAWLRGSAGGPAARLLCWLSQAGRAPLLLDVVGIAALGALIWFFHWFGEYQPFLYRGGFALVALTTVLVIAVVVHPRARLVPRLLSPGVMRWIGTRSYSLYLWHWPVFAVTRPQLDVPIQGILLLALRLLLTAILAEASYRWVETPFRSGAVGRAWKAFRDAQGARQRQLRIRWAGAAGTGVSLMLVLGVAVVGAQQPAPPSYLSSLSSVHATAVGGGAPGPSIPAASSPQPSGSGETQGGPQSAPPNQPTASTEPAAPQPSGPVTAIGDSVMAGAAGVLQQEISPLNIDAEIGMQTANAIDLLRARRDAGQLGQVVVVHIGNNGVFTSAQFDDMMQVLTGVQTVLFVNVKVPRPWEGPNNGVLAGGVSRYSNAKLVDWRRESEDRPDLFWDDGIHLRPEGQQLYADLIAGQVQAAEAAP